MQKALWDDEYLVEYAGLALDILKDASFRFCKLWQVALEGISDTTSYIAIEIELLCE